MANNCLVCRTSERHCYLGQDTEWNSPLDAMIPSEQDEIAVWYPQDYGEYSCRSGRIMDIDEWRKWRAVKVVTVPAEA